jgi:hypothetical protein
MSGFTTATNEHLIRSQLWSSQIKEVLEDELMGLTYVNMISDFPDGETLNIPSIGQAQVHDYAENSAVKYNAFDTGNFQFTVNKYKQTGVYITNKHKQDSFYMSQLMGTFVPNMTRAIMKSMEVDMLAVGPDNQTSSDTNTINGGYHRFVAGGTNQVIELEDFAKAHYALQKANVPMRNLVAIVDPSVGHTLSTLSNLTDVSNNPKWEGIITSGISDGHRFIRNVYGFDVYVSQNLKSGIAETIDSVSVTNGAANLFFSADSAVTPFVGQIRQAPTVESEYNKDFQREEYVVTCRYGFDLFRPENLVTVISDTNRVY